MNNKFILVILIFLTIEYYRIGKTHLHCLTLTANGQDWHEIRRFQSINCRGYDENICKCLV